VALPGAEAPPSRAGWEKNWRREKKDGGGGRKKTLLEVGGALVPRRWRQAGPTYARARVGEQKRETRDKIDLRHSPAEEGGLKKRKKEEKKGTAVLAAQHSHLYKTAAAPHDEESGEEEKRGKGGKKKNMLPSCSSLWTRADDGVGC